MPAFVDKKGSRIGKLLVIERDLSKPNGVYWICRCDCGGLTSIKSSNLSTRAVKSCGCLGGKFKDLTGKRFNSLLVLKRIEFKGCVKYECLCDCGKIHLVRSYNLVNGAVKSCGCKKQKRGDESTSYKHGMTKSNEFSIWQAMLNRCRNKNHSTYYLYGGRGIGVCDRWKNSFQSFYDDMGPRPTARHSIERIDSNGNYEPKNCKWATSKEQANNVSTNRILNVDGVIGTMTYFAELYGIKPATVWARLKNGWTESDAVKKPIKSPMRKTFENDA